MPLSQLRRNTIIGLVISLILAAGKFVAGIVGNSSALVADGVESLADAFGSIVVWQGFRIAEREPDDQHPYGYGRAETIAAFCVGALLLVSAAIIVVRAFQQILVPHNPPAPWTLIVLLIVIAAKEALFRVILYHARRHQSDAAYADAWHHRSDAITSVIALFGVSIAIWGPHLLSIPTLVLADEVAAILASGIILYTGLHLARPAARELLDVTSDEFANKVRATAESVEGARLVEKLHARKAGRGYLIDLHLHVDPDLNVRSAHNLAGKVKAAIHERHPNVTHVLIHIEPDERHVLPHT